MKWERWFLIAFFGNYVINNVVAGIASLLPAGAAGSVITVQYVTFIVLAAIVVALLTMWYFRPLSKAMALKWAVVFGIGGFVISVLTTFVSGISGVLAQTGSVSTLMSVLPNFGPYLWSWSTLVLLGYWVIPAALIGWWLQPKGGMMHSGSAGSHQM